MPNQLPEPPDPPSARGIYTPAGSTSWVTYATLPFDVGVLTVNFSPSSSGGNHLAKLGEPFYGQEKLMDMCRPSPPPTLLLDQQYRWIWKDGLAIPQEGHPRVWNPSWSITYGNEKSKTKEWSVEMGATASGPGFEITIVTTLGESETITVYNETSSEDSREIPIPGTLTGPDGREYKKARVDLWHLERQMAVVDGTEALWNYTAKFHPHSWKERTATFKALWIDASYKNVVSIWSYFDQDDNLAGAAVVPLV